MESFKNIRELCLAAATDRWKSEKSAFLRVLVKKLQGPEKWFLENQSSTYRWKRDLRRKKLRFNFEILFCSIFIREIMAWKFKKGRRAQEKIALKIFGTFFRQYNLNFFLRTLQRFLAENFRTYRRLGWALKFFKEIKKFPFFQRSVAAVRDDSRIFLKIGKNQLKPSSKSPKVSVS